MQSKRKVTVSDQKAFLSARKKNFTLVARNICLRKKDSTTKQDNYSRQISFEEIKNVDGSTLPSAFFQLQSFEILVYFLADGEKVAA